MLLFENFYKSYFKSTLPVSKFRLPLKKSWIPILALPSTFFLASLSSNTSPASLEMAVPPVVFKGNKTLADSYWRHEMKTNYSKCTCLTWKMKFHFAIPLSGASWGVVHIVIYSYLTLLLRPCRGLTNKFRRMSWNENKLAKTSSMSRIKINPPICHVVKNNATSAAVEFEVRNVVF